MLQHTNTHKKSRTKIYQYINLQKRLRNKLLENYSKIINPKGQANPQSGNPLTKFEQKEK